MATTTEDKLRMAFDSKEDIRNAIETKGVECGTDVPLSHYGDKIRSIKTGGGGITHGPVSPGNVSFGKAIYFAGVGTFVEEVRQEEVIE